MKEGKMITIKDVPMLTADEKEIKLNSIVYTTNWSSGYEWNKEGKAEVEAHRVISINNSARYFRTRCTKGCETSHEFAKGCSRQQIWGSLEFAKSEIIKKIETDLEKAEKKSLKITATISHILAQKKLAKTLAVSEIKEPKAVKV